MMHLRGFDAAVLLVGLALTGCGGAAPRTPGARAQGPGSVHYDVHVAGMDPCVLDVSVTLSGGADLLLANAPGGVVSVEVQGPEGPRAAARDGAQWPIRCDGTCVARYRLDLSAIADSGDAKAAFRAGPDLVAPASTWLLRPEPLSVDVPVTIQVHTPPGVQFASGLRQRADGTIDLRAQELRYAGYSAFGTFETFRVDATEGVVDVAVLGGGDDERRAPLLEGWVRAAASSLDHVYGRFPVKRAQVFVVSTAGSSRVDLGRTLPSGGASTLLFVGEDASARDFSEDWILTHELFHLGVPSFWREGRWLDEGLATYYEPVIRTRAGQLSDYDLWSEFATQMPLGLPAVGGPSLTRDTDHGRIYWGGALFVLLADVEIRRRTGGARSLDDGLRAVQDRGGDATKVWTVADFIAVIDEAVSVPVMHDLYARASAEGRGSCSAPLSLIEVCPERGDRELTGLLHDLGIGALEPGAIAIADDARWSELRRAIERPPAPRPRSLDAARLPIGRAIR
jgi:hypothetical protein